MKKNIRLSAACAAILLTGCGGAAEESSQVVTHGPLIIPETTTATTEPEPLTAPRTETTATDENGEVVYPAVSWRDAFSQKLRDIAATSGYISKTMNPESYSRYSIADLTGDGMPELMIAYNSDPNTAVSIYTLGRDGIPLVAAECGYNGEIEFDAGHGGWIVAKQEKEDSNSYEAYALTANGLVQKLTLMDSLGEELYPPDDWEPEPAAVLTPATTDEEGNEIPAETEPAPQYGEDASYFVNGELVERDEYMSYYENYFANPGNVTYGGLHDFDVNTTPESLIW